jgi:hypothetical protein
VDILNPFLLVLSVYQAGVAAIGFFHLRGRLKGVLGAASRGAWPDPDKVAGRQQRAARRAARLAKFRQRLERFRGRE